MSAKGIARFVGAGTAVVTATVTGLPNGKVVTSATPSLVALAPAARVRALPTRVDAAPGTRVPLAALVYDSGGNQIRYPISFASDNAAVASIAGTTLMAAAVGTAQLTVGADFRGRGVNVTVPVAIVPVTPGPYHIDLVALGAVDPAYPAVFARAAAFWESVITATLPSADVSLVADACDTGTPALNTTMTGLTIFFSVDSIDGKGKILGEAGPCVLRSDAASQPRGLPVVGTMRFDSADFATLVSRGTAYDVIRHEMGHVLGIGTLWDVAGVHAYLSGAGTFDPVYVGPLGESGSAANGFTLDGVGVPVENLGGPGTADAHWRSSVFGAELMTGYLSSATTHPASRLTVLSLADLGYAVNVAAAEPLLVPAASSVAAARGPSASRAAGELLTDVALPPIYTVTPGRRVRRIPGAALRVRRGVAAR
ncbi:hypothetical protein tb265_29350 [Gemmatimonadetes bacterium T265]|nr:hypothetical protein tb265_29350 [Gemmatimonadetes bacterium T265]